jgi:hypothetical protein
MEYLENVEDLRGAVEIILWSTGEKARIGAYPTNK